VSQHIWSWFQSHGKLSPLNSFTVVNSNDRFAQFSDSTDAFIKEELTKRGVKVEYGMNLVEVDMKTYTAKFKNLKTNEVVTRPYSNLYSLLPTKPHASLQQAGLLSTNGLLDVDHQTLRHRKYKNIFGLGDVCNLPTT
jgi:thioredoxin reductase